MAFRFRLETLLRLRRRELELAESSFSQALEILRDWDRRRAAVEEERRRIETACADAMLCGIPVEDYLIMVGRIHFLEEACAHAETEIVRSKGEVEAARLALVERKRSAQVVERLMAREQVRYEHEERERMQREADEFAIIRHVSRRRQGRS